MKHTASSPSKCSNFRGFAGTVAMLIGAFVFLVVSEAYAGDRNVEIERAQPSSPVEVQFGKAWAVVVGIDNYESLPHLKYGVADTNAMSSLLRSRGFQVTEILDRQATRDAILGELGDRLVERVGNQDRVIVFFAGHGHTRKVEGGKEMGYLMPVAGKQDALAKTAISMGLIRELAEALPAKQVLFLMDTCYGGIAGQQFRSIPEMTEQYLKVVTRERGRQLITAGGANQEALEGPEWGHSVFTYYLLEGLGKGLADLNDDGCSATIRTAG